LGINFNRFDKVIIDPSIFRMEELIVLAKLFSVYSKKFIDMAYEQILSNLGIKEKKPLSKNETPSKEWLVILFLCGLYNFLLYDGK
jgi:hypothetical protein